MDLAARLQRLGMTKQEFAEACGVKPSAVSNWIKRSNHPETAEAILKLSELKTRDSRVERMPEAPPSPESYVSKGFSCESKFQLGDVVRARDDGHVGPVVRIDYRWCAHEGREPTLTTAVYLKRPASQAKDGKGKVVKNVPSWVYRYPESQLVAYEGR